MADSMETEPVEPAAAPAIVSTAPTTTTAPASTQAAPAASSASPASNALGLTTAPSVPAVAASASQSQPAAPAALPVAAVSAAPAASAPASAAASAAGDSGSPEASAAATLQAVAAAASSFANSNNNAASSSSSSATVTAPASTSTAPAAAPPVDGAIDMSRSRSGSNTLGLPNPLPPGYNPDLPICANCSTQTTPLWRRSPDSNAILCNACALFFKMKGRPRPISLKTDVIKSRNRSKGKSTSKDRLSGNSFTITPGTAAPPTPAKAAATAPGARSTSTSRSRADGRVGAKSAPGGSELSDSEMDVTMGDGRTTSFGDGVYDDPSSLGRKARRTLPGVSDVSGAHQRNQSPSGYGHHPYAARGHGQAPYPPRSRSSVSNSRRTQSLDRSGGDQQSPQQHQGPHMNPYHFGFPGAVPGSGYHPSDYYNSYYGPQPGSDQLPPRAYPPPAFGPGAHAPFNPAMGPMRGGPYAAHYQHKQSDSRSQSSGAEDGAADGGSGAGDDRPKANGKEGAGAHPGQPAPIPAGYYAHPNPNFSRGGPFSGGPFAQTAAAAAAKGKAPAPAEERQLDSIGEYSADSWRAQHPHPAPVPRPTPQNMGPRASGPTVPRYTGLFETRLPANATAAYGGAAGDSNVPGDDRGHRAASVSTDGASGSSEGLRSPDQRPGAGRDSWIAAEEDERRGRSEVRTAELLGIGGHEGHSAMGDLPSHHMLGPQDSPRTKAAAMMGVEHGIGELRMGEGGKGPWPVGAPGSVSGRSPVLPPAAGGRLNSTNSGSGSGSGSRGRSREEGGRGRLSTFTSSVRQSHSGGGSGGAGSQSRSHSSSRGRGTSKTLSAIRSPSRSSTNGPPLTLGAAEIEISRLRTKVAELNFMNELLMSRLAQLEGPGRVPISMMGGSSRRGAEDEMAEDDEGAFNDGPTPVAYAQPEADEELEHYGVTAKDPETRSVLLQYLRQQQQQQQAQAP